MGAFDYIKDLIQKNGAMPIDQYMQIALQHPDFGYYRKQNPIGKAGDFITAPEISQMFGEMIGIWIAELWQSMGRQNPFILLELGPGRGTLMGDILRATAKVPNFHDAMQIFMIESSAVLRDTQRAKLSQYNLNYIDDVADLPKLPIIFVGNEFLDALPIRQFEKMLAGWCERMVGLRDDRLVFVQSPVDDMFAQIIPEDRRDAPAGTIYELSLQGAKIIQHSAKHIMDYGGGGLWIDYGYMEGAGQSTFQAVTQHRYADVLADVGDVDLTAHVDFGMGKKVAQKYGCSVLGAVGQGDFLRALGIEIRAGMLRKNAPDGAGIDRALHRLIDGGEMGNLFKVMAMMNPAINFTTGF